MSIRDQIFATTDDLQSEVVTVPEWGDLKLTVREMTVRDRNAYLQSLTELADLPGGQFINVPKQDPLAEARLVILTAFDENGERVFQDGDAEQLGQRAASAVDRLAKVATRLSGIGADEEQEAGKGSAPTETNSSSSS